MQKIKIFASQPSEMEMKKEQQHEKKEGRNGKKKSEKKGEKEREKKASQENLRKQTKRNGSRVLTLELLNVHKLIYIPRNR